MQTEAKRWIYLVSNIGPTSRLWAELRCSNVGFQRSANELIDVRPTLGQHMHVCWDIVTIVSTYNDSQVKLFKYNISHVPS